MRAYVNIVILPSLDNVHGLRCFSLLMHKTQILRILKYKQIGRHYFDPLHPISIHQHKVELWPGYFTSINPNQEGVMLIADVAHKVLRTGTFFTYELNTHPAQALFSSCACCSYAILARITKQPYSHPSFSICASMLVSFFKFFFIISLIFFSLCVIMYVRLRARSAE